jgi:uncharacterized protein (DUF1330 family)
MACLMLVLANPDGNNREGLKKYMTEGPKILAQYGGKHLVAGGNALPLEGAWPWKAIVASQWESREAALAFWNSPEYTALKVFREGTGDYQIAIVDCLP